MTKKRKGFTLIELLAVIVILGLLMAIAIPSVTKYITQSRKKTVTTTIGNYISALTNQVNDMEYTFTATNTIYAVPIECIALERGGINPFGEWHQASNVYWAYVLVQYDDATSSYTYGFTFKDSAGYGLYPITSEKLNESGSQINTDLDLTKPINGTITNITAKANWTGFDLEDDTKLVVLEAESEGTPGDGKTTCTLCQKGNNYVDVEQEKNMRLSKLIREHNPVITSAPTLTTVSKNSSDVSGLYVSTATNSGNPTYYFRGSVANNHVKFAGLTWKIIRVNEDGTVRLILNDNINGMKYKFNTSSLSYNYMYYSNSDIAKPTIENWYKTNIIDKGYDSYVATTAFCEQAKVNSASYHQGGNATLTLYSNYIPNFKCSIDGYDKGILNAKVGLITYDELIYAGGYYNISNSKYYLYNGSYAMWTMSPGGRESYSFARVWFVKNTGDVSTNIVGDAGSGNPSGGTNYFRPVISLNVNVVASGSGTSSDPYVVQTN